MCSLSPNPVPQALGPRARRCSIRRCSREVPGSGAGLDSSECPLPAEVLFPARSVFPPERVGSPLRPPAPPLRLCELRPRSGARPRRRDPAGPIPGEGSRAAGVYSGSPSLRGAGHPGLGAALILDAHIILLHRNLRLGRHCLRGENTGVGQ